MKTASTTAVSKKSVKEKVQNDEIVLKMDHISKSFNDHPVLVDMNIELHKGENLVIFGKSGSGKSVLIKCIVGLNHHDEGTMVIFGEDVDDLGQNELTAMRTKIGFLFQSGALYDSMSVRENLEFPLRTQIHSMSKETLNGLIEEALHNVGLDSSINKAPSELSGGMRKRLGLARTLILKPEIMLYDEPTTGLDPITSKEISKLILDVQEKYQTSSIIITHDIECARLTADRIIVIKEGVCEAEGTFVELQHSKNAWVRSFFE
ncbi:MAG: ATP-binding cassette domain-containing protein [Bacteroidota bacterium]